MSHYDPTSTRHPPTLDNPGNLHCTITWDGKDAHPSNVIVLDLSSNGTFVSRLRLFSSDEQGFQTSPQINGVKIGKNQTRILREGQEIAFGTTVPQPANGGLEDYREHRCICPTQPSCYHLRI